MSVPAYSITEKRETVVQLLATCPEKPQRWIAKQAGVSQPFVHKVAKEMQGFVFPPTHIVKTDIKATCEILVMHFDPVDLINTIKELTHKKTAT